MVNKEAKANHQEPIQETNSRSGPLAGVRILDLTRLYPGPLCTELLAGMGATIIKIEHPSKIDLTRVMPPFDGANTAVFNALNRGKRSLALDVTTPRGREIFLSLVKEADVVIEGFRPGTLARSGISYESAREQNDQIIYVSISGYGQTGPYSQQAGHDLNYIAYAGILGITGSSGGGPIQPGFQIADTAAGAYMAVIATLAALHGRTQTGEGQFVDVSMLDSCLPLMTLQLANQWSSGIPQERGKSMLGGGSPNYGIYECADGRYIALAALEPKFWDRFCAAIDKNNWNDRILIPSDFFKLKDDLANLFKTKPQTDWIALNQLANCCLTPVLDLEQLGNDPHLVSRGMILDSTSGTKTLGFPIKFHGTPTAPLTRPAPTLGEDTRALLTESGFSQDQIAELVRLGIIVSPN